MVAKATGKSGKIRDCQVLDLIEDAVSAVFQLFRACIDVSGFDPLPGEW